MQDEEAIVLFDDVPTMERVETIINGWQRSELLFKLTISDGSLGELAL